MRIKIYLIIVLLIVTGVLFVFRQKEGDGAMANSNHKVLVAYFSRTGEQYGVGNIKKGNTAIIAEMIADATGGDLFEIKVAKDDYPEEYDALVNYARVEKQKNARPELAGKIKEFDKYDVVFLGYPNWWGDMPMPVYTFIDSYDLSSKQVYHFCTHEGSGSVKKGLAVYGHVAQNERETAKKKVDEWLKTLDL